MHEKHFPYHNHLANSGCLRGKGCWESREDWHCFTLSLLPQSVILITGITTTNFLSLRIIELVYWRWRSLIKMLAIEIANYPTLLIPSQEQVVSFNFHPKFSIFIYYSCPSSPICLEIISFCSSIKIRSITLPLHFELGRSNHPKTLTTLARRKDMSIKCLTAVHQNYMVTCFPYVLDFGQSSNFFYGISVFLKITFA